MQIYIFWKLRACLKLWKLVRCRTQSKRTHEQTTYVNRNFISSFKKLQTKKKKKKELLLYSKHLPVTWLIYTASLFLSAREHPHESNKGSLEINGFTIFILTQKSKLMVLTSKHHLHKPLRGKKCFNDTVLF